MRFKVFVLREMLLIVDSHLQVCEVLLLIWCELDAAILYLELLLIVETFRVKFILVVNDEMVCTVCERYDRGVRETPSKAASYGYGESQLVELWSEKLDVNDSRVHACYLIESLVLCFIFLLVFHDLCFQELIFEEAKLLWGPKAR